MRAGQARLSRLRSGQVRSGQARTCRPKGDRCQDPAKWLQSHTATGVASKVALACHAMPHTHSAPSRTTHLHAPVSQRQPAPEAVPQAQQPVHVATVVVLPGLLHPRLSRRHGRQRRRLGLPGLHVLWARSGSGSSNRQRRPIRRGTKGLLPPGLCRCRCPLCVRERQRLSRRPGAGLPWVRVLRVHVRQRLRRAALRHLHRRVFRHRRCDVAPRLQAGACGGGRPVAQQHPHRGLARPVRHPATHRALQQHAGGVGARPVLGAAQGKGRG